MTKLGTDGIIVTIMVAHSGEWVLSRDVTRDFMAYNRSVNAKAVGKRMLEIVEEGFVERREHSEADTRVIGARYSYKWIGWKLGDERVREKILTPKNKGGGLPSTPREGRLDEELRYPQHHLAERHLNYIGPPQRPDGLHGEAGTRQAQEGGRIPYTVPVELNRHQAQPT